MKKIYRHEYLVSWFWGEHPPWWTDSVRPLHGHAEASVGQRVFAYWTKQPGTTWASGWYEAELLQVRRFEDGEEEEEEDDDDIGKWIISHLSHPTKGEMFFFVGRGSVSIPTGETSNDDIWSLDRYDARRYPTREEAEADVKLFNLQDIVVEQIKR